MLDSVVNAQELVGRASVAAFVTFHYRIDTMQFLDRVLRNLSSFCVGRMHVTVVTNACDHETTQKIQKLGRNYFLRDDYDVACCPALPQPRMLTWAHKPLLRTALQAAYDYFIYLEDDIDLTFNNFLYFVRYVDALSSYRLVPSFLRTEFNTEAGELRSTDALHPTRLNDLSLVEVLGQAFASPGNPYCASYILTRTLASEYVTSRSFDAEQSRGVSDWGLTERAAMGVCWDNPPEGYTHRYVLPVSLNLVPRPFCQTPHMSSKYTNADTQFGRVPVNRVFVA